MSKTKLILTASTLLLVIVGCNTLSTPTPTAGPIPTVIVEPTFVIQQNEPPKSEAGVPRVSLEEAYAAWASGAAVIVDVRGKSSYDNSHIPNALNILLGEFETNIAGIDLGKDQWIITYCT